MQSQKAFDHTHYIPILKGKKSEFNALAQLYPQHKAGLTPLIEVQPVAWDYDADEPKKDEFVHLTSVVKNMHKAWGVSSPFYVDLVTGDLSNPVDGDPNGHHPYACFFDLARAKGLLAIPVIPLNPDPHLLAAVLTIMATDGRGVMVRVSREDFTDATFLPRLANVTTTLGMPGRQIDLLIDIEDVEPGTAATYRMLLAQVLPHLPYLTSWRTLTVASCGFPENISDYAVGAIDTMPRIEWTLWTSLIAQLPQGVRRPTFGDYGITYTELPAIDMRFVDPRNNIRYTVATERLIVRGQSRKKKQAPPNPQLCQMLMGDPRFCGANFSEGDKHITLCATGQVGPGHMGTWVQVGTNHHLTFVVDQLAKMFASSAPAAPGPVVGPAGGTP